MSLPGYVWKPLSEVLADIPPLQAQAAIDEKYPNAWGVWCRWQWMMTLTGMIEDVVIVVHGPEGCQASARVFHGAHFEQVFGLPFMHAPSSAMDNEQVILGGEEDLAEPIRRVDAAYKPPLIVVHSNCCAGLNMDNVELVVENLREEVNARLIYIPSEGFSCTWTGQVAELNVPMYAQLMEPPKKIDPKAVNMIGLYKDLWSNEKGNSPSRGCKAKYASNADDLARMIEALGLTPHRALFGGNYESFRTAPEAAVNAIDCPCWGYPLAKAMQELYGTPYLKQAKPIGVETTIKWINELAEFMHVEHAATKYINYEYDRIKDVWEQAKQLAKGKVALIDGTRAAGAAVTRPLAQARFAMELGMRPYMYLLHPMAIKAKEETIRYFLGEGVDPLVLYGPFPEQKPPFPESALIEDLGVEPSDVVYFHNDVFPFARLDKMDASNTAEFANAGQPFRRTKCGSRDIGFRGTEGMARDLIAAIMASKRGKDDVRRGTLYARLRGPSFEFELPPQGAEKA